jgi:hypothetical protein
MCLKYQQIYLAKESLKQPCNARHTLFRRHRSEHDKCGTCPRESDPSITARHSPSDHDQHIQDATHISVELHEMRRAQQERPVTFTRVTLTG